MANQNLSQFTEKTFVADADWTFVWDTAGLISKKVSRNSLLNSGTLTTDAPVTISQTWNAGTNVMTAFKVVATDTASGTASKLLELWSGSTPALKSYVTKAGTFVGGVSAANSTAALAFPDSGSYSVGIYSPASYKIQFAMASGGPGSAVAGAYLGLQYEMTAGVLSWGITAQDIVLARDASNTLALRNGAAAQTFNVYGTYSTSPSLAYSRLAIACDTSGNATLTTQSTGTAGTVSINGVPVGRGKGSNVVRNISIGENSLGLNSTGADNTAIGYYALQGNGAGGFNTSIGSQSLFSSNSNHNVALGYLAGAFKAGGATNNPGNENVYIGSQTKALDTAQFNQIVIGYDATGLGSNTAVLGNSSITTTALRGNVGIGTTAPSSKLQVSAGDVEVDTIAKGVILKSPDGTRYRVTVANGGTLSVAAV
jgi:hypothetical protein